MPIELVDLHVTLEPGWCRQGRRITGVMQDSDGDKGDGTRTLSGNPSRKETVKATRKREKDGTSTANMVIDLEQLVLSGMYTGNAAIGAPSTVVPRDQFRSSPRSLDPHSGMRHPHIFRSRQSLFLTSMML
jgi:hypothetical protein